MNLHRKNKIGNSSLDILSAEHWSFS